MFVTHKRKIPCELKGAVELKCFCVDDSFKGKGIGTSILKSILDTNPFVILDCKKGSRNESFYTKNGLSIYGEKHVGNTDVLLMKKISDKVKTLF